LERLAQSPAQVRRRRNYLIGAALRAASGTLIGIGIKAIAGAGAAARQWRVCRAKAKCQKPAM